MAELLNLQDLANGRLDAKSLGQAANGDENTTVITRTGETYPSAKKAIKTMFQNGALPAEPFATKAKMITDGTSLADDSYAMVTDDKLVVDDVVGKNNGLYIKKAGTWVKTGYDPVAQARDYTDFAKAAAIEQASTELKDKLSSFRAESVTVSDDLEVAFDSRSDIYRKVDSTGEMFVSNLVGSVQENLRKQSKVVLAPTGTSDIEQVWDVDDNLISRTDNRGALYIVGGKGSVQHFMREPLNDVLSTVLKNL